MSNDIFWVDRAAKEVIEKEKSLGRAKIYRAEMGLGASGIPHVGSVGDGIRSYSVYLALRNLGFKSQFIAFSDDRDGLRKIPFGFPASLEKDIGKPVSAIDDPFGCHDSYATHISSLLADSFEKLGVKFILKRASTEYPKGTFDKEVAEILSKSDEAGKIIKELLGQEKYTEQLPFLPVCKECGRIYTTRAYEFKNGRILYKCDLNFLGKNIAAGKEIEIKGCGYEGGCGIREGKLSWKVEFAARWRALKINYEAYGKDILDSVRCNDEISSKILGYEPPAHSFYELFTERSGKKISKSTGNVFTPQMWLRYASPQSLRLLFLKRLATPRVVDLDAIPAYMDEIDELGKIYFGKTKIANEKELGHMKRIYEYAYFLKPPKKEPISIHYNMLAELLNISKHNEMVKNILKKTGHIQQKLAKKGEKELDERLEYASNWLKDSVREEFVEKFVLSESQKNSLRVLIKDLKKRKWDEKSLYARLFEIPKECNLNANQFFEAAYLVLMNNKRGPRLAQLILELGTTETAKTLEERLVECK